MIQFVYPTVSARMCSPASTAINPTCPLAPEATETIPIRGASSRTSQSRSVYHGSAAASD